MDKNVFTKLPKRGDIVVGNKSTGKLCFITLASFEDVSLSDTYERIGVVASRTGKKVLYVYKNSADKKFNNRIYWNLTGYTLDGTERSGKITAAFASASWGTIAKTITYTASDKDELIAALNAAFAADTDFTAQDWYATLDGENVVLHCNASDYRQYSNSASEGFTLSGSLPDITALANMRRKHGGAGGEGAISSLYRAIAYYRASTGTASYEGNTTVDLTSVRTTYPINLNNYLGHSSDNQDHCALLRATYGEGENGWLKYMQSCLPVYPTDFGNMGIKDGAAICKTMASHKYTSATQLTPAPMFAGADYCNEISTVCLPKGTFHLPTTEELAKVLVSIQYGTSGSRNADVLNEGLYKINGTAISNSSYFWSCLRYYTYGGWNANGNLGFFGSNYMYYANRCVPVALFNL